MVRNYNTEERKEEEGIDQGVREFLDEDDGKDGKSSPELSGPPSREDNADDEFVPLLQDLVNLRDSLEGKEARGVLYHHIREYWKRLKAEAATATATATASAVTATTADDPEDAVLESRKSNEVPHALAPTSVLALQGNVEAHADLPEPGAYTVHFGREPQRTTSGDPSVDSAVTSDPWEAPAPRQNRGGSSAGDDRPYLVEANLVDEEVENGPAPPLVEAKPIRRKRQIAIIAIAGLTLAALVVGLVVGLWPEPRTLTLEPTPAPTDYPTASPSSQLDELFRPTLPSYTLESLKNASSPQYCAYQWETKVDQMPMREEPDHTRRRLERMRQRFALATLFYATGGKRTWKERNRWLRPTEHESSWFGLYGEVSLLPQYGEIPTMSPVKKRAGLSQSAR